MVAKLRRNLSITAVEFLICALRLTGDVHALRCLQVPYERNPATANELHGRDNPTNLAAGAAAASVDLISVEAGEKEGDDDRRRDREERRRRAEVVALYMS